MISAIISAIIVGLIVGALGRLVVPGKQNISIWVTMAIGIVAALIGTFIANALGVGNTNGIDWIKLVIQVALAAVGVALVAGGARSRSLRCSGVPPPGRLSTTAHRPTGRWGPPGPHRPAARPGVCPCGGYRPVASSVLPAGNPVGLPVPTVPDAGRRHLRRRRDLA